ncbi:hypothetical protein DPEC_G00045350 [Dallia pectoralis]|uniref:Uncharacterized protein n=1 Tax=Dallia pectoralis TaxID=75939 RepID=A0ACC2HA92_DALPE|nr:hypothetical protein DPEC_G00045350 [Dallia pectoralis]
MWRSPWFQKPRNSGFCGKNGPGLGYCRCGMAEYSSYLPSGRHMKKCDPQSPPFSYLFSSPSIRVTAAPPHTPPPPPHPGSSMLQHWLCPLTPEQRARERIQADSTATQPIGVP